MTTASQKFGILESVYQGLLKSKREEVERVCEAYKKANLWTGTSYGRSKRIMNMPMTEANRNNDNIFYLNSDDSAFPGDSFDKAAPKLERMGKNLMSIFVSNSGETDDTVESMGQLYKYMPHRKGNWSTILATQNGITSRAGKLANENEAIIFNLDGSENKDSTNYREFGMMRDKGEFGWLWGGQTIAQIVMENRKPEDFYTIIEKKLPVVFGQIDAWSESPECKRIVQDLANAKNIMVAGRKTSRDSAKFLTKRLQQEMQILNMLKRERGMEEGGGNAYIMGGSNCPDPEEGDVVIPISKSGSKEGFYSNTLSGKDSQMMGICRKSLEAKAKVHPVVATHDSLMEQLCGKENTTVVGNYDSNFSDAYAVITTQTGILPYLLAEELNERGFVIDTKNLKKTHGL